MIIVSTPCPASVARRCLALPEVDSCNFLPDKTLGRESASRPVAGIKKSGLGATSLPETLHRSFSEVLIQEATVGFEPTHKGFAGPRRVLLGPYAVIASNPVKGFHFACSEKDQDPLPSFFLPGNKLTN